MVDIVSLGYNVETSEVLKGEQALDDLTNSTLNADAASKKLSTSTLAMGKNVSSAATSASNLNRSFLQGNGFRNVSLQLNQVAQQSLATGNFMQALAIQIPDIAAGFGTLAIVGGTVAGVLAPLALTLIDNLTSAEDLDDALDRLSDTVSTLERSLDLARLTTDELAVTYGVAANRVREFALAQAEIQAAQAAAALRDQIDILGDTVRAYTTAQDAGRNYRNTLTRIERDLGLTNDKAREFESLLSDLGQVSTFDEQQTALAGILSLLDESNVSLSEVPPELQRALNEMITLSNETDRARELMRQLAAESSQVNVAGIGAAPQVGDNNLLPPQELEDQTSGSARGGRGRTDPYEDNLNRLVESLQTERETLEVWYAESEVLLNDHRARKLLGEEEHKAALLALEEEYAARQSALADQTAQHEISAKQRATNAITGLLGALAGDSKAAAIALIAVNKGLAIAQAIQNTAVAQTRALAELGPIFGPPAAAKIAAFGKVQIAAIAATGLAQAASASSGSLGSVTSTDGSTETGASDTTATDTTTSSRTIVLDLGGSFAISDEAFAEITERIQEESDLGVIFEVVR